MGFLLLSPDPGVGNTSYFEGQDKVAHFILFLVWSFLVYMARSRSLKFDYKAVLFVALVAAAIAFVTELIQGYMPNRSSDAEDLFFDLLGMLVGIPLGYFSKKELSYTEKKFDK